MRLTVITPTKGRDSLRATLASITPQLEDGDEYLVIGDGPQPVAAALCAEFGVTYHDGPLCHTYGATQRDYGIALAAGDWLAFCDDDDTFTPDALALIRTAVERVPHLFRMQSPRGVLWERQQVREGNVGTPMLVTPRYDDMPKWDDGLYPYTGDHRFIKRLTDAHGVVWREEIICNVR